MGAAILTFPGHRRRAYPSRSLHPTDPLPAGVVRLKPRRAQVAHNNRGEFALHALMLAMCGDEAGREIVRKAKLYLEFAAAMSGNDLAADAVAMVKDVR